MRIRALGTAVAVLAAGSAFALLPVSPASACAFGFTGVETWKDADFHGPYKEFCTPDMDLSNNTFNDGSPANDQISSYHNGQGVTIWVYEHANRGGQSRSAPAGSWVGLTYLNDMISSIYWDCPKCSY